MRGRAKRTKRRAPCVCGRVVAVRYAVQELGLGAGKARVPHHCPHGKPCIAGRLSHGFTSNTLCDDCRNGGRS